MAHVLTVLRDRYPQSDDIRLALRFTLEFETALTVEAAQEQELVQDLRTLEATIRRASAENAAAVEDGARQELVRAMRSLEATIRGAEQGESACASRAS